MTVESTYLASNDLQLKDNLVNFLTYVNCQHVTMLVYISRYKMKAANLAG